MKDKTLKEIKFKNLLAYFIIYSFLGFIVETLYGVITKGVLESRQSFLYGPFCGIYGLGAVIIIQILKKIQNNNIHLFISGIILGSILEYLVSLIGEIIYQIKWWDYSNNILNINGRICLIYSIFWGFCSIGLMRFVNPKIDLLINKINPKCFTIIITALTIFLIIDSLLTGLGLKVFYTRLVSDYNLELKNTNMLTVDKSLLENKIIKFLSENIFTNEKMLKTFPNIKLKDVNNQIIYVRDILNNIQPYYLKIY